MTNVKIMPEYHCSPIWIKNSQGFFEPIEIEVFFATIKFNIECNVKNRLVNWNKKYQETFDATDPMQSGFKSNYDEIKFVKEGEKIVSDLATLFSLYKFEYHCT